MQTTKGQKKMQPAEAKYTVFDTALGAAGFVVRGGKMVASYLPGATAAAELRRQIEQGHPGARFDAQLMPAWRKQFVDYFAGRPAPLSIPVDLAGCTPFQRKVLHALQRIRRGYTVTYGQLAETAGSPGAARAVGGAVAHNPLPLVIPCHRVLGCGGKLGGFSAGAGPALKRRMLDIEGGGD